MEERSIVRHWVMRNTVHLFPTEDFGWLTPLFSGRIVNWSMRRLEQLGLTPAQRDRALAAIRRSIEKDGAVSRTEAMEAAARTGIEIDVERRTHLSVITVVGGTACIGADDGGLSMFAATGEWIGEQKAVDREDSLAELARRYFRAFAPATERDFQKWSGLPLGQCRLGMKRIEGELDERSSPAGALVVPRGFRARSPRSPAVRLLGAFDTYLMGYASRSHAVDQAGERVILPGGGIVRPTICVDGRFVGTWKQSKAKDSLTVTLEPFAELDELWLSGLEAEARDLARFEGLRQGVLAGWA